MSDREARLALSCVIEPGDPDITAAVASRGAEAVWESLCRTEPRTAFTERVRAFDADAVLAKAALASARFIIPGDPEWPAQIDQLNGSEPVNEVTGAPLGLWVRGSGDLVQLAATAITFAGSRAATAYGERVATEFAADLSDAGHATVAGGGFGIDAAAHRGCLAGPTATVVVVPGGISEDYPSAHRDLFERVARTGGVVVSELPPGEMPTRQRFLARSRLLAALSTATVLVEAAPRSGALNVLTWAAHLQRVIAAVPGPINSVASLGPHILIREHQASLVSRAADILAEIDGAHLSTPPAGDQLSAPWEIVTIREASPMSAPRTTEPGPQATLRTLI